MEQHSNDERLREELGALIKTVVDAIVSTDQEGTIRLCNPSVERMFGWQVGELLGKNVKVLMPNEHASRHDGYMAHYLDTGEAKIIGKGRQLRARRKDGSYFPVYLSIGEFPVGDDRYFVGVLRDLTAELKEQVRMQELENQLAVMGRRSAVSEMGASLAHELNQPLTAIDLFLTAAQREFPKNPDKALGHFEEARVEAQRAGAIVRRIRKMIEGGEQKRKLFLLKPVIEDAIKLCTLVEGNNPARFELTGADDVAVLGDETQIRQVLVNLVKNALEATELQNDRVVHVGVHHKRYVDIDVADNGPGVNAEMKERLFEPFQSSKDGGLGVGLSICRTIAENHGGELMLLPISSSYKGLPGACFRLRLPESDLPHEEDVE